MEILISILVIIFFIIFVNIYKILNKVDKIKENNNYMSIEIKRLKNILRRLKSQKF